MREVPWPHRPPPDLGSDASTVRASPACLADVTSLRRGLRSAVAEGWAPTCTDSDVERLLLAFEELASNALRHGRPPACVAVTTTSTGWLLDVSDTAVNRPPTPPVDRDPAQGGLGLYLVARLCAAHGWLIEEDRKHVWAHLVCAAEASGDEEGLSTA